MFSLKNKGVLKVHSNRSEMRGTCLTLLLHVPIKLNTRDKIKGRRREVRRHSLVLVVHADNTSS